MGHPLKVALFTNSFHPVTGGVQTVVGILARELKATGCEVQIITNRYPRNLDSKEIWHGIPVYRILLVKPFRLGGGFIRSGKAVLSWMLAPVNSLRLLKRLRKFAPDVVNIHFPEHQIWYWARVKEKLSAKLVVSVHGDDIMRFTKSDLTNHPHSDIQPLRELLEEANSIVVCSGYMKDLLIQLFPLMGEKAFVVPNPITNCESDAAPNDIDGRYVFAYGRLTPKKGFDILIADWPLVVSKHPDVRLLIAGDGALHEELQALVSELGLENTVAFLGKKTAIEIAGLLSRAECVVIPSRVEPFGLVALESMAAGKAIVAHDTGGLRELMHGTGNKLTSLFPGSLAVEICQFLREPEWARVIGEENKKIAGVYSTVLFRERYIELFRYAAPLVLIPTTDMSRGIKQEIS